MKLHLVLLAIFLVLAQALPAAPIDINGPTGATAFGRRVTMLPNGNFVVVDDDASAINPTAGAVYLYSPAGVLISTLSGSSAGDRVGAGGITVLPNGNYVVRSPFWDNGAATDAGAVTWCSMTTGCEGTVSAANSLVGSSSGDAVGGAAPFVLPNSNYFIRAINWDLSPTVINAGSVTWCDGTAGTSGVVGPTISLVGGNASDAVGSSGVIILTGGDAVAASPSWRSGMGAATWMSGTAPTTGFVGSGNSLTGSNAGDGVATSVQALSNGHYVVVSPSWNSSRGAVTWADGGTGLTGLVDTNNSLTGALAGDLIGSEAVVPLTNGNYVVCSPECTINAIADAGAATFCDGSGSLSAVVGMTNSLYGTSNTDRVGSDGAVALSTGNYVVSSRQWNRSISQADAGAVTWGSGTTGITGAVSIANSLVGTTQDDAVGQVHALDTGHYVVISPSWNNFALIGMFDVGAVTWGNGYLGITGAVDDTNSAYGSLAFDSLGSGGITKLPDGDYIVISPLMDNNGSGTQDAGSALRLDGNGLAPLSVDSTNCSIGLSDGDGIGMSVVALDDSSWVVVMPRFDGNSQDTGAVRFHWINGPQVGQISVQNASTGNSQDDKVGSGGVFPLPGGRYVVVSPDWNGPGIDLGAVTWFDPLQPQNAPITAANSLIGSTAGDRIGSGSAFVFGDHLVFRSPLWDNGITTDAGAATLIDGTVGLIGTISATNSVLNAGSSPQVAYNTALGSMVVGNRFANRVTIFGSSTINFSSATYQVTEGAGTLQVPIIRTGYTAEDVIVQATTTAGTATANADYLSINSQTFTFNTASTGDTLSIPIFAGNAINEPNETFTVSLTITTPNAVLGNIPTATVTIVEPNSTAPGSASIIAPGASSLLDVSTNATIAVTGTATDPDGVSAVEVSLNGAAFVPATLTPTSATSADWTLTVTPAGGRNDVMVRLVDGSANVSGLSSRTFTVRRDLAVSVTGSGSVSAGFVPTSFRSVGSTVTITATPTAGSLFNGWIVSGPPAAIAPISQSMRDNATLTFTFREGISLVASFASNPFNAAMTGVFNGTIAGNPLLPDRPPLLTDMGEDGTGNSISTTGYFSAKVTPTGAFTAVITIDSMSVKIAGVFDANGVARFGKNRASTLIVPRKNKPSLIVALNFDVTPPLSGQIQGTVSALDFQQNIDAVSDITMVRAPFDGRTPATTVPATLLGANNATMLYTVVLPSLNPFQPLTTPQGDGIGSIKLGKNGTLSGSGSLADGTPFSFATTIDSDLKWSVFLLLYKKGGYITGGAQFDTNQPASDVAATANWRWSRPLNMAEHYYPMGWNGFINVGFTGARYTLTPGSPALRVPGGFDPSPVSPLGNADATFADGQITVPLTKSFNISPTNKITTLDTTWKAALAAPKGIISGTFIHPDGSKPKYQAVILQKGLQAGAYGYFLTVKPRVIDYTGQGGGVTIIGR